MLLYKMTMAIKLSQSFLNLLSGRMMKFFFFSSSLPESSLSVSQIFSRRMRRRLFSSYVLMVFWCELLDSEKEEEVFFSCDDVEFDDDDFSLFDLIKLYSS